MRTATRNDSPIATRDAFERAMAEAEMVNGTDKSGPTTRVVTDPYGRTSTFIVQTIRWRDPAEPGARSRDTVFVQQIDSEGGTRYVLPPAVADAIATQREALTARARTRAGRAAMEARQADGTPRPNPLADPKVRAKALDARKAKAAKRRARRERKAAAK
jgi:hypothetical protein